MPTALLTCLCLMLLLPAAAETAKGQQGQAGGHLLVGFPAGAFKDRIGGPGFGLAGHLGYSPREQPYLIGLQLGFLNYGSQTVPMMTGSRTVDVTWSNNILLVHAMGRVQPQAGVLRPYVEGLLGFNWMFTTSSFQTWEGSDQDPTTTTNLEFDDTGFSYGGGGGIMIAMAGIFGGEEELSGEEAESEAGANLLIDLGVRYLAGKRTQYLRSGSISTSGGAVTFEPVQSDTDLLIVMVGVSLRF
jgi:hypothetical protein